MVDNLAYQAFLKLYGREPEGTLHVQYHGGFKEYNANVRKQGNIITFNLSRKFEQCEPEIQMGVMQYLLNRLYKTKHKTDEQELYHTFVRKLSEFAPVTKTDAQLEKSFHRVNDAYFHGMMSKPNLTWGTYNKRLLGTYTYATDTIMISSVLENAPEEILDYVVYHEMLHKKHKFSCSPGRTHSHTKAFKRDETNYIVPDAEAKLTRFLRGSASKKESSFLHRIMGWT